MIQKSSPSCNPKKEPKIKNLLCRIEININCQGRKEQVTRGGCMETEHKAIITGILLALSLMTALLLESRITSGVKYQLVFIFLGILVSAAIVFGLMMRRAWAYPLGIIVFTGERSVVVCGITFAVGVCVWNSGQHRWVSHLSVQSRVRSY